MTGTTGPLVPKPAPDAPLPDDKPFSWTALAVFLGISIYAVYLWLWLIDGRPVGAAILLGPLLVAVTAPLFVRAGRRTHDFDLGGLLLFGLLVRFALVQYRFDHAQDAFGYHANAIRLAAAYRHFNFAEPTGRPIPGTGGMRAVAGVLHVFVNDDYFASFLVMAWLGFLGCWLLYRAFELSVADGDRYRYARLVMLWPAMCFWPSSLGKDAWMVFTVGVAAYGVARVFNRTFGGYTLIGLGLFGASFVRPHLALLTLLAFFIPLILGRRQEVRASITPGFLAKLVGIALVIALGSVLVVRTQRLLDIEDFSSASIASATADVSNQTQEGGATFTAPNPRTPVGFVTATVTVLFRPFPTEAHGFEQTLGALEGLALAVITLVSLRRLLTVPRRLRRQPYVTFALVFVLLWILAFGIIGNFGILARQRTQMLPFYFVLLSVATVVAKPQPAAMGTEQPSRR